jgi:amidase/aspartyl-tRNA(Asn)/glutamyl-tRNA(Gln) amidotransferase subunit A
LFTIIVLPDPGKTGQESPLDETIHYWSATRLAEAIRRRQVSPVEIIETIASRIESKNPGINAYCTLDLNRARESAKESQEALARNDSVGPLHGVPVAVKDDLAVQGIRYTCGSNLLAEYVADYDDLTVERLKRAGAIILGKTNLPEFGHKGTTDNLLFGPTNNPWRKDCIAGGSSGGSAAAVAIGMCYLALGTDIGGSIRIPASCCGIVGFKPSLGRIPRVPSGNFFNMAWTSGPMARTVDDVVLGYRVLAGPDPRDPFSLPPIAAGELDQTNNLRGIRIAFSPCPIKKGRVESIVVDAARSKLDLLRSLGVQIENIEDQLEVPRAEADNLLSGDCLSMFILMGINSWWRYMGLRAMGCFSKKYRLSPSFVPFASRSFRTSLVHYLTGQKEVTDYVEKKANRIFESYDLLASPTLALPPFPHPGLAQLGPAELDGKPLGDRHLGWFFTWPFNLTGQPAISIPCGRTEDGLPLGLQIVGQKGADALVLRVAREIERLGPWNDRRPPD